MSQSATPPRKAPQFSLRTLLIVVTIVAIAAALFSVLADLAEAVVLLLLAAVVPVCVATLAFYCRGYRRTFFAGALGGLLLPMAMMFDTPPRVHRPGTLLAVSVFEATAILSCGCTALFTRRLVENRGWHLPAESSDPGNSE